MSPVRRVFIDTDTASDDAVALMMALHHMEHHSDFEIAGIGVVAGNVPLEQGLQNALYTAELCHLEVPIYAGRAAPLLRTLSTSREVHGYDGMGDIDLPLSGRHPTEGDAVEALLAAADGSLELITLGPLTNIAVALLRDPRLSRRIRRCWLMGGASDYIGNVTPVSEYNIWVDPEAAEIVFSSGMALTMVGWDIALKYGTVSPEERRQLRALNTPKAQVAIDCQSTLIKYMRQKSGSETSCLPDPVTMAAALDPTMVTSHLQCPVYAIGGEGPARGMTMLDHQQMLDETRPAITVVTAIDRARFMALLYESLQ